ncbi:MAG: HEAT repeat domain-containing protein [Kiritimatiellae bacterium]|nr:HEAT repeat domain-containing protein [Kiritimatiellia bacterium]MDD5519900.1 HEAT repeat domain-containing protein [Kiritimatiellia bacterium]
MKKYIFAISAVLLARMILSSSCLGAEAVTNKMEDFIGVLKSDVGLEQKVAACRELGLVGNKEAVPVLAGLLSDEKLAHMARYGLEQIPDPAVDEAFRTALDKLKGQLLVGVINSIGDRRDVVAIEPLSKLLKDSDQQVARAAAAALGRIGTVEAGKALDEAIDQAKSVELQFLCEELLACAGTLVSQRKESKALGFYEKMSKADVAGRIKAAATRGVILCSGRINLLVEQLNSDDQLMFAMGLRVAQELKGRKVTSALIFQVGRLPAEKVIQLVQVLGKRKDKAAVKELITLTKNGDKNVRKAAITALAEIGDSSAAPVLMELLRDTDSEIVQIASISLASLPDPAVNADVVKMLDCPESVIRVRMLDLVGQRRIKKALPVIMNAMDDKDETVRIAAIRNVGVMAGMEELPVLLDKIIKSTNTVEISTLEKAVSSICSTGSDQDVCVQKLTETLSKANPSSKPALLRALRVVGGPAALKVVRGAIADSNKNVHSAAIRVLGEWKTTDVVPVLLELAKGSSEQVDKILGLRGYLGMASRREIPQKERLAICKEAVSMIQRDEEKKMLLGALGSIANAGSLNLVMPYLDEPGVRIEAAATVMAIAEKRGRKQNISMAKNALQKVVKITDNPSIAKRAEELLQQIEKEK